MARSRMGDDIMDRFEKELTVVKKIADLVWDLEASQMERVASYMQSLSWEKRKDEEIKNRELYGRDVRPLLAENQPLPSGSL